MANPLRTFVNIRRGEWTLAISMFLYFFLVILGAWAFGPRMGFLLGALSFVLSAFVTGGLGPWLPFQVFAAAWM